MAVARTPSPKTWPHSLKVLFAGGAAGVAEQGPGHRRRVRSAPGNRDFHRTGPLQLRRSRSRWSTGLTDRCT